MVKIEAYKNKITGFYVDYERVDLSRFIEEVINRELNERDISSIWADAKEKENSIAVKVWCYDDQIDSAIFGIKDKRSKKDVEELIERIVSYLIKNIEIEHY